MVGLRIELRGDDLFCREAGSSGADTRRPLDEATFARLANWANRYDRAVVTNAWDALPAIGQEIAQFLDGDDAWLSRCLAGVGEIVFEIIVTGTPDERGRVLLDVPWELLAPNALFLAADNERLFRVERRLGQPATPRPPKYRDLGLVFMAAHVEGESVLNYEHEESAILQATQRLDLNLIVEESGARDFLGETLANERPEALHLSCHGTIANGTPVVILETSAGGAEPASAADLTAILGDDEQKPGLIFLSACRTAEHGPAASAYTQALIRAGVANALGWDGSVYDADAIGFAETFYAQLAQGRSVAHAAAQARRALLQTHLADRQQGLHWHLARVYLGPAGGGPLCDRGKPKRLFRKDAGYREFLDKAHSRVPVASAAEFVGRRRQAQRILRAFHNREAAGVLVHGMGNLGKSSLAARIASRMPHHDPVVLFERYDAAAVFEALVAALPPGLRRNLEDTWREAVLNDDRVLADALQEMLEGPFRCEDSDVKTRPILLIVDDLEQILAPPKPGETATPVEPAYAATLVAIITAFAAAESTDSWLLLTSRYTFCLGDGHGGDLAERLLPVPLPPMDAVQQDKQMHAAAVLAAKAKPADAPDERTRQAALEKRIKDAAGGNPGLQEILFRPLLNGETGTAERAVAAVEAYLATGDLPAEASAAIEFFERVSLTTYRAMLTHAEETQLRAATLFSLPVPLAALHAAGGALGVATPLAALARLAGLGLVDLYFRSNNTVEAAVNPLARPLVQALSDTETRALATEAVVPLYRDWDDGCQYPPVNLLAVEVARLALIAKAPADLLNRAALAAAALHLRVFGNDRSSLNLVKATVAQLDSVGATPDIDLLRFGADSADHLGESEIGDDFLERGAQNKECDAHARARLLFIYGRRLIDRGDVATAEAMLKEAAMTFEKFGDFHNRSNSISMIARILVGKEKPTEAFSLLQEHVLPHYDQSRQGILARAVVMGDVADILWRLGQPDKALQIRREEQLPVFKGLGDVRNLATTLGKIGDMLFERCELDEALRICREQELPLYEWSGDVLGRAIALGKIADVLERRRELNEALRIREEEELPIYSRLRIPRGYAVTWGKIATIWELRGFQRRALRIRRTVVLPEFKRLDDPKLIIVELGKIAENLEKLRKLDNAIEIHIRDRLPAAEKMGDLDTISHIRLCCARIRLHRGGLNRGEAQIIYDELKVSFEISRQIARPDQFGWAGLHLGRLMAITGRTEEALAVLDAAGEAFTTLQQPENLVRVLALQKHIRGGASSAEAR